MLTVDEVRKALPPHLKSAATQSLVDSLNTIPVDPEAARSIRENFISFSNVLKDSRFKLEDYLNAVAYVSFRMMGHNNQESYARALPDRYQRLVAKGTSSKDIAAYVTAFNKGKLVTMLMEQAMIPVWLINQDAMQRAINKQIDLMDSAKSEMVQHLAAKSLMETLKRPETKDVNINLGTVEDKGLEEMRQMMVSLAQRQQQLIESGASTREIAHQKLIIDAEVIDD